MREILLNIVVSDHVTTSRPIQPYYQVIETYIYMIFITKHKHINFESYIVYIDNYNCLYL